MLKWLPFESEIEALSEFVKRKADSRKARWGLYFYSALESIILPVPTDPLLGACVYAAPNRWRQLAIWTAFFSMIGGLIGWGFGWFMGDAVTFVLQNNTLPFLTAEKFEAVSGQFTEHGLLIVLLGAFTPLPFKLVTITAGLFKFSILPFIVTAFLGRSIRFLLIAALIKYHRSPKFLVLISSIIGFVIMMSYVIIGH